ncbi:MAG: enamine deaminase RidA [Spirochaetae bacterium HGW-Spirochaetae-8]|jgi:2-iminobutanoate/2-iminopropanoate deaminase|nr:MAG: enamine deaminase RidA [Spirochaetae bacterium HGW-Spirochaetae-8]
MEFITIEGALTKAGHYSPAVRAGSTIYISGQIPIDPFSGERCLGDISAQTGQVLINLDHVLAACGVARAQVAKVTIYLADMGHWDIVNRLYAAYFGNHKPARSIVPTRELHHGFGIELEAIVYSPQV